MARCHVSMLGGEGHQSALELIVVRMDSSGLHSPKKKLKKKKKKKIEQKQKNKVFHNKIKQNHENDL